MCEGAATIAVGGEEDRMRDLLVLDALRQYVLEFAHVWRRVDLLSRMWCYYAIARPSTEVAVLRRSPMIRLLSSKGAVTEALSAKWEGLGRTTTSRCFHIHTDRELPTRRSGIPQARGLDHLLS